MQQRSLLGQLLRQSMFAAVNMIRLSCPKVRGSDTPPLLPPSVATTSLSMEVGGPLIMQSKIQGILLLAYKLFKQNHITEKGASAPSCGKKTFYPLWNFQRRQKLLVKEDSFLLKDTKLQLDR